MPLKSQDITVFVEPFENSNSVLQSQTSLEYEAVEGSRSLPYVPVECYSNEKSLLESSKAYYTEPLENLVLLPSEGCNLEDHKKQNIDEPSERLISSQQDISTSQSSSLLCVLIQVGGIIWQLKRILASYSRSRTDCLRTW